MIIKSFTIEQAEAAKKIALDNYYEEKLAVPELPDTAEIPMIDFFAKNGLGVAAFEEDKLIGFLGCWEPWVNAFDFMGDLGTFSPIIAHGAVKENRKKIYQRMYEAAAKIWYEKGITAHAIGLYAHDQEAILAFFQYGFDQRCADKIRKIESIKKIENADLVFEELEVSRFPEIRDLRIALDNHLKESPCFMKSTEEEIEAWLKKVEAGDRRTFVARKDGTVIAYIDIAQEGETFITYSDKMANIQGAYCKPEYRGQGFYQDLLEYVIEKLKAEGYELLGVDHESINPTASNFWKKYFTDYTCSVVRKLP